jgi:hypothetical protein
MFDNVAGGPQTIDASTIRVSQHRYNIRSGAEYTLRRIAEQ